MENKDFLKSAKNVFFDVQNVLDPLLSLYVYLFIPKVLLKDQKMLNLWRMKKYRKKQMQAKKTGFLGKICIKVYLDIEKTMW